MQASLHLREPTGTGAGRPAGASDEPAAEALAEALAAFVQRLLVTTQPDLFAAIEKTGLSITQVKCLHVLREAEEPLSVGGLSRQLGLSLPAVSRAVEALVRRGQVRREPDPRDRRCKLVTASAAGRRTSERLLAHRVAAIRHFVDELEPHEREGLADVLEPVMRRLGA